MKVFQRLMLSIAILGTVAFTTPTYAASDADCSIWLCLPMGFPSGCGDAKSAFKKRIKKFKPPLPSLSSCLVSSDVESPQGEITSTDGFAALIPERQVCSRWERKRRRDEWETYCAEYETIPTHVIKNTRCVVHRERGESRIYTPTGCSRTIRYVDSYIDGQPNGDTYYFDDGGNEISLP